MPTRRKLNPVRDAGVILLADVVPVLKNVVVAALDLANIVEGFRENKAEWQDLSEHIQQLTANVIEPLNRPEHPFDDGDRTRLKALEEVLQEVADRVKLELAKQQRRTSVVRFIKDPDVVTKLKTQVEEAVAEFERGTKIATRIDVRKIRNELEAHGKTLDEFAHGISSAKQTAALDKLRRVEGASWDISRVCLPNTRSCLIDDILTWASNTNRPNANTATTGEDDSGETKIMLFTAVAGGGKTTIAHTVAQRLANQDQLASSFFFDHETDGRNNPTALFTTIVADISRLNPHLAARIASAIEDDPSLPSAPLSRQFEELVLKPCCEFPFVRPMVVVIDALDEAWSDDLVDILRDRACHLPPTFRIFLISRMRQELDHLCRKTHVCQLELDIAGDENEDDIITFAEHRLRHVADEGDLGDEWPDETLRWTFITKAGGLFLWVATVCDYLRYRDDPTEELKKIVSNSGASATRAEERMDQLYASILGAFDWTDPGFVAGYRRLMGIVIASKIPLTVSAMRMLYGEQTLASNMTLRRLSPLLTGMKKEEHDQVPVRLLHQSLRDFLVDRAGKSAGRTKFQIVEEEHNEILGLLSLQLLYRQLHPGMPGTGYLTDGKDDAPGVPRLSDQEIPEALSYACRFWLDHLQDIESWSGPMINQLEMLLQSRATLWLELSAALGLCQGFGHALTRDETRTAGPKVLDILWDDDIYADACHRLAPRLVYEGRQEEALLVADEAVRAYRQLAFNQPSSFTFRLWISFLTLSDCLAALGHHERALTLAENTNDLVEDTVLVQPTEFLSAQAASFSNLAARLSDMRRYGEALAAQTQAVKVYQRLAGSSPTMFMLRFICSLNDASVLLSTVGHHKEALIAMKPVVEQFRRLSADRPAIFMHRFAKSLTDLANCLSELGHSEEALARTEEAVGLFRQLAADRPGTFMRPLAQSLRTLSCRLYNLGHVEQAIKTTRQTIKIHRQLAEDQPVPFVQNLSQSLAALSHCLYMSNRREEALEPMEEAVELDRELALDQPTAFTHRLVQSLITLSGRQSDLGEHAAALTGTREALKLIQTTEPQNSVAFASSYGSSLETIASIFTALGYDEEAASATRHLASLGA